MKKTSLILIMLLGSACCVAFIVFFRYQADDEFRLEEYVWDSNHAYYYESWDRGNGGTGSTGTWECFTNGGHLNGFCRYHVDIKQGVDHNHIPNFGVMYLVSYLATGPIYKPSAFLGGGDPDLREASISVSIRGNDFKLNGANLLLWVAAQKNIGVLNEIGDDGIPKWRRANWGYTDFPLNEYLSDGKWHRVEFTLRGNEAAWKFAGNNPQQKELAVRYDYWPIEDVLSHLNVDFIFALTNIDDNNPPVGSIDFDELIIKYKNKSLIHPANGGELIRAPENSVDDPRKLTDGIRFGENHVWRSALQPSSPQVFIFALSQPETIKTIQLHQNIDHPTSDVEVFVSLDGSEYKSVLKERMDGVSKEAMSDNFAFIIKNLGSTRAKYIKVVLHLGYRERWGLGEIEVF